MRGGELLGLALALMLLSSAAAGRADEASRSVAQVLFDDGVRLMTAGKCDDDKVDGAKLATCREALDKFRRAWTIHPEALGALRNAAFCERGLGLVASAARDFREVARRAPLDPSPSKQLWAKHAADEADRLEPRVPRVTLSVEAGGKPDVPGLKVQLDGAPFAHAALGTSLPIDPGPHEVEASAPGHVASKRTLLLAEGELRELRITLERNPPPPPLPPDAPRKRSVLPFVALGAGVVTLGLGLGLGALAKSARDDACDVGASPIRCSDPQGLDRARGWATASTVVTVVGGLATAGGVAWIVVSRTGGAKVVVAPSIGADVAGMRVWGAF